MTTKLAGVPRYLVERWAAGELEAAAAEDVRARLVAAGLDPEAERAAIAASNREMLERLPKARVASEVKARLARQRQRRVRTPWLVAVPTLGAALAAVTFLVARPSVDRSGDAQDSTGWEVTQVKGTAPRDARLVVYRQPRDERGAPEPLRDGARAQRGDLVQLAYEAEAGRYGVLVSLDGTGNVTVHLPEAGAGRAVPLKSPREVRLGSSFELDAAPSFERFFLVTARTPFDVTLAVDAARALASRGPTAAASAPLPLAPELAQSTVRLDKPAKETTP